MYTHIQTDGWNCSLLKLTSVYAGKLEKALNNLIFKRTKSLVFARTGFHQTHMEETAYLGSSVGVLRRLVPSITGISSSLTTSVPRLARPWYTLHLRRWWKWSWGPWWRLWCWCALLTPSKSLLWSFILVYIPQPGGVLDHTLVVLVKKAPGILAKLQEYNYSFFVWPHHAPPLLLQNILQTYKRI